MSPAQSKKHPPGPIRTTQRAPQSCLPCARRKVKCNKKIPCNQCVSRGQPALCGREVVSVRGQVRTGDQDESRSYDELLQDNARLQALVRGIDGRDSGGNRLEDEKMPAIIEKEADDSDCEKTQLATAFVEDDQTAQYEKAVFTALNQSAPVRRLHGEDDILMPSQSSSTRLVDYAEHWTWWIHFADLSPRFRREHEDFWARKANLPKSENAPIDPNQEETEPLWLAVYFSILASTLVFLTDRELATMELPTNMDRKALLLNWYEAALLYMNKGDFMRQPHVRTVRAIAILGTVFNHVGDVQFHTTMWAIGIRIARALELGSDRAQISRCHARTTEPPEPEIYADQQARRRLWWTLIICEWLAVPYRPPSVSDVDFDCAFPDYVDDDELVFGGVRGPSRLSRSKPRPVQYHVVMAKVARIYHLLQYKLRVRRWSSQDVAEFVRAADDQLANVIVEVPAFLSLSTEATTPSQKEMELQHPWIPWQKRNLKRLLLSYRIGINRLLQGHWLLGSIDAARTRAICLSTARAIIHTTLDGYDAELKPWHVAINVFSAAVTLVLESRGSAAADPDGRDSNFTGDIDLALQFLQRVAVQNPLAEHSIPVLKELLGF